MRICADQDCLERSVVRRSEGDIRMKTSRCVCLSLIGSLVMSAVVPGVVLAGETVEAAPQVSAEAKAERLKPVDVSLAEDGKLRGVLLDSQGEPVVDQQVVIYRDGEEVASSKSNGEGAFELDGIKGGLLAIASEEGGGMFRVWTSHTAPPSAKDVAVVYHDASIVRGNGPRSWIKKPVLIGAAIAGAVILPIALHDNEAS